MTSLSGNYSEIFIHVNQTVIECDNCTIINEDKYRLVTIPYISVALYSAFMH